MPEITITLPRSVLDALRLRERTTGEPVEHLVATALARELGLDHATLFQVSTAGALVAGVYEGVVTAAELLSHGDLGLGTFAGLDGEMVLVDGRCWRVAGTGEVAEAAPDARIPFALVTRFRRERVAHVAGITSLAALEAALASLRGSPNLFYAVRIDGRFARLHTRAVCKAEPGKGLAEAAAAQREFELIDVEASIVGFWTPPFGAAIGIPGWHLHAITKDRRAGGHLLDLAAGPQEVAIEPLDEFRLAIPETAAFLAANLRGDPSAVLEKAER